MLKHCIYIKLPWLVMPLYDSYLFFVFEGRNGFTFYLLLFFRNGSKKASALRPKGFLFVRSVLLPFDLSSSDFLLFLKIIFFPPLSESILERLTGKLKFRSRHKLTETSNLKYSSNPSHICYFCVHRYLFWPLSYYIFCNFFPRIILIKIMLSRNFLSVTLLILKLKFFNYDLSIIKFNK